MQNRLYSNNYVYYIPAVSGLNGYVYYISAVSGINDYANYIPAVSGFNGSWCNISIDGFLVRMTFFDFQSLFFTPTLPIYKLLE